jgi:hypothetical protein
MSLQSLFSRFCHFPVTRRAVTLVILVALAWSSPAFCGEIHDAARDGDLGKVKTLLKSNPDLVFSKDDAGRTPLHWAAGVGHKDVAESLLANRADVNAVDSLGMTPLQDAAGYGYKDVAELLRQHGAQDVSTPVQPAPAAAAQIFPDEADLARSRVHWQHNQFCRRGQC